MTRISSLALAALALVLAGCLSDSSDPDAPPPATGSTGVPDIDPASSTFRVQFDPLKALVPYPNDILGFLAAPDTDGSLNVPQQPLQPLAPLVNELDGFSTNGRIQANFTENLLVSDIFFGRKILVQIGAPDGNVTVTKIMITRGNHIRNAAVETIESTGYRPPL